MKPVIVSDLKKTYNNGSITAVNSINFEVEKGELFGLIGPDGAGKTSVFRMLTTLLLPDGGAANVAGFDIVKDYKQIRKRVGYMPGRFSLYQDLTIEENLEFFATVFGTTIQENYHLIKDIYVQIEPFKNRRAGKLSGGMKQKLALCCALIHKPEILFLDEPTTGVDVVSRKEFWDMLKRLKEQGITILVSTPYMDEASLCDRIALFYNGNILQVNTPYEVTRSYNGHLIEVKSDEIYRLIRDIKTYPLTQSCYAFGEYLHVSFHENNETFQSGLTKFLQEKNHSGIEMHSIKPGIEDCFIQVSASINQQQEV